MKRPARLKNHKALSVKRQGKKLLVQWFQFFIVIPVLLLCFLEFGIWNLPKVRAAAGINKEINFQGKLVDNNGLNVTDSTYTVVFSLYNVSSGGTAVWTESDSVPTQNGVFQVALGANTAFPGNVDFNSDTWYLGIKVGSDAEMTPRVRFTAVPYAFNAAALDGVVATNSASQFTITGATNSLLTLTVNGSLTLGSTIQPTATGTLTVQSTGAQGLTLDTGGAAALTIGASANSITIGNTTAANNTALTLKTGGSGILTLGSNNGTGNVLITPNAGGQAALIINDQGNGDILTASESGAPVFTVARVSGTPVNGFTFTGATTTNGITEAATGTDTNIGLTINGKGSGAITISGSGTGNVVVGNSSTAALKFGNFVTANQVLYISATDGTVAGVTVNSGAVECLTQTSGGTPVWGACGGAGSTLQGAYNSGQTIDLSQAGTGLTIGTGVGTQNVIIAPNAGGQAALIINDQGLGPVLTASASGSTVLVLSHAGNLGIGSSNPQQGLTLGPTTNLAGEMAAPTGVNASAQTGGTLTNGNYFYVVTASDGIGQTIQSAESPVVCTSTNAGGGKHQCLVIWNSVVGAVSYSLYRTQNSGVYTGSTFITSTSSTSFLDSVTSPSAGTPPTATTAYVTKFTFSGNSWLIGDNFGLGTSTPLTTLDVEGGKSGGNAAMIVNQLGAATNDVFTASISGAPVFTVAHVSGTVANGFTFTGSATTNAVAEAATGTDTNIGLTIDGKGSGTVTINGTGTGTTTIGHGLTLTSGTTLTVTGDTITGAPTWGSSQAITISTASQPSITSLGTLTGLSISGVLGITSNSSTAFAVGANGSTTPALLVDASTGSSVTGLQIKSAAAGAGLALTVISSAGQTNENLTLDAKGAGTITIGGTSTGNITIGSSSTGTITLGGSGSNGGLTFSTTTGPSYTGGGRPTKSIVLSAEYSGAVLTASGSGQISGNMTSDASPSAVTTTGNNYENYYQWTATALGSDQQYTVAVRVTLPKDFSDWASVNAITVDFNTPFTNSALNSLDVFIYKGGDTTGKPVAFSKANVSGTSKNWAQVTFTKTQLTTIAPTLTAAGQVAVFYLTLHSTNTVNYVQVGDITLNYLAAF